MGIYLNPGCGRYSETVASKVFVDKTEMILYLNTLVSTEQKYVCVSRPRRFGKSIAANMLSAYYGRGDGVALFSSCKVANYENWDRYLAAFDVIRVVMTDFFREGVDVEKVIAKLSARVLDDLHESYPDVVYDSEDLSYSLERFYKRSVRRFVVVIDEWDAIFRECKDDEKGQTIYLDFLRDWLKDKEYIALAYMTGILPIKKYGKHSALNMFFEYSMVSPMQMASYTGFTEEEVRELCEQFNMSYEDISAWYDGYRLSDFVPVNMRERYREGEYAGHLLSIYSPLSVVNAISTGIIENYWNQTENYEALADYIRRDYDGLKETTAILIDGGRVKVNISRYQNDMTTFSGRDDILTLLVHLGYLCYDRETKEVFIPNKEILDVFKDSTEGSEWVDTFRTFKVSQELLVAIWCADEGKTAQLMELAHDRAGNKTYNNEAALSYGIQYALYAAQKYYSTIQELDTGKGYADLMYLPSPQYPEIPVLLMELKYDKDVETAASQVKERNYPQVLEHYIGNILVASVNYDKNAKAEGFKKHSCKIVRR